MPLQAANNRERDIVAPGDGRTLAALLESHIGPEAAALIAVGAIWVDGARARDATLAPEAGSLIRIRRPPPDRAGAVHFGPELIVYEDEDLIAVNKPAGMYVDATPWDADNHLRGALTNWLAQRDGRMPHIHLVHRLDRDTSGVLLFSKEPDVNAELQRSFVQGRVAKTYLAHCAGVPRSRSFELTTGHGRGRYGMLRIYPLEAVGMNLPGGKHVRRMQTRFEIAQHDDESALVLAFPMTGRTHQIRLHLALIGCPLIGDVKYGGPLAWHGERMAAHRLHAARLEIAQPRSGAALRIEAPLPPWAR